MKNMTNEQLIRATYVVAKYENPKTAQLLTELAGRLDCALVAARTACLERDAAVRAEIEWETAMRQAVGEDGVDDVVLAIEKLKAALDVQSARSDALAAENVVIIYLARTFADRADEYKSSMFGYRVSESVDELNNAGSKEFTDAAIASLRAEGVEMFVSDFTEPAVMNDGKFYSEDLIKASKDFAAQLRGGQV